MQLYQICFPFSGGSRKFPAFQTFHFAFLVWFKSIILQTLRNSEEIKKIFVVFTIWFFECNAADNKNLLRFCSLCLARLLFFLNILLPPNVRREQRHTEENPKKNKKFYVFYALETA